LDFAFFMPMKPQEDPIMSTLPSQITSIHPQNGLSLHRVVFPHGKGRSPKCGKGRVRKNPTTHMRAREGVGWELSATQPKPKGVTTV